MMASGLIILVSFVAAQTMAKHRANELTDSLLLESLEKNCGILIDGVPPHSKPVDRAYAMKNDQFKKCCVLMRSFRLWIAAFILIAVVALSVIILTILHISM
jgi:hypothetical protein